MQQDYATHTTGSDTITARLVEPQHLSHLELHQHDKLEQRFQECRCPGNSDIMLIAAEVGLSEDEAKIWFQHRLAIWRKTQGLPANSGRFT